MQSFQITTALPTGQKNYVFVDEHNRHKRLKVMRACEGCRRRKIKCDSATTNTWPCTACQRLKLQCVPPVTGNEGEIPDNMDSEVPADSIEASQPEKGQSASFDSFQSSGDQDFKPYQLLATYLQPDPEYPNTGHSHTEKYIPTYSQSYGVPTAKDSVFIDSPMYSSTLPISAMPRVDLNSPSQLEQSTADLSEQMG